MSIFDIKGQKQYEINGELTVKEFLHSIKDEFKDEKVKFTVWDDNGSDLWFGWGEIENGEVKIKPNEIFAEQMQICTATLTLHGELMLTAKRKKDK